MAHSLLIRAGETEKIPQQFILPDIGITATRSERESFEIPHTVTLLDSPQVEQANVTATPDLFDFAEGVYIQKTNLGGGSPFVRGMTGKQVLILVDGVRLNNSFYRFGPHQYLNTIDPNIIERVEVVRGPGSVLYGSDALGGVVNIITKRRKDFLKSTDIDGRIQGQYDSSVEGGSGRLQIEGNICDFGWLGGATGKHYDDLEAGNDLGEQVPSGYDEYDVDLKLNGWLDDHNELILTTQHTRQFDVPKTSEVTLGDKLQFNYEPQLRSLIVGEYRGEDIGVFDRIMLNVSYNRQKEGEEIVEQSTPTLETREVTDVKTIGATAQLTNQLGRQHHFTYGVDYYRDDYDTKKTEIDQTTGERTALIPGTPDGAEYESLGVYIQDEILVTERIDAVLGVRYSDYETQGSNRRPNLASQDR
jgi:outer membrane receptor protein involved in Fe transport